MSNSGVVLLLSYWGANDVLTASAVLPHLEVLKEFSCFDKIVLVTIERDNDAKINYSDASKVIHYTLKSNNYSINLLNKINDFLTFPEQLQQIINSEKISSIIAFGSPAGALGLKIYKREKLPFYVAYYEPHATYMLESGVWKFYDPRYLFQKKWDRQQAVVANGLITVSKAFYDFILKEGLSTPEKVLHVQNGVDLEKFSYNLNERNGIRQKLTFPSDATIGIYVGKYGGLYYDQEVFKIYKKCFTLIPDFKLIILSPQDNEEILIKLQANKIDLTKVWIASVDHQEVPKYLAAADFAFATYKPGPSKKYLSPVKIGEYWANGLPVLLTEGVGDDSDIIKNEGGGALFNLSKNRSLEDAISKIQEIIKNPVHRQEIAKLALKYRSPDRIKKAYKYFFGSQEEVQ